MCGSMGYVETTVEIREMLVALAGRYAFRELAYLLGAGATGLALNQRELARIQQLCAYGKRLIELDMEDLDEANAAIGATTDTTFATLVGTELVPDQIVARGELSRVRQDPQESVNDALTSLYPMYRLLLEVIQIRWFRNDPLWLLAAAHIAAEYGPMLAWQRYLGHAGDPFRLRHDPAFAGPGSRFGHIHDADCPHTQPAKAACGRAMRVADQPTSGWRNYLDRQHSVVSQALGACATDCPFPCTVMTQFTPDERAQLTEACRVTLAYRGSALVRLRHRAPVGHGFGVPSLEEVADAWKRSRQSIAKRGGIGMAAMAEDGFVMPGMPSLFSAIAGVPLSPDNLVRLTVDQVVDALDPDRVVH
jgi:hypothetical protein